METLEVEDIGSLFGDIIQRVDEADYSRTFTEFMPELAAMEAGMFAGEYDSNLEDWPALAESTIKRKGHDRILVETGALRESLVQIGGPDNVHEAFEKGMVYGTSDAKALFHQFGTSRMPKRSPVGITDEVMDKLVNVVADHAVDVAMGE